jgi:hypothetical protein
MTSTLFFRPRVLGVGLLLSGALLTPEIILMASALDPRPICVITAEWVAKNSASLPKDYDHVLAFPAAYRRAILHKLPPQEQAALWATHLARALTHIPDLGIDQHRWLESLVLRLRTDGLPSPNSSDLDDLGREITLRFGKRPDVVRLFTQFGPNEGRYTRSLTASWLTLTDVVRRSIVVSAQSNDCNCSLQDDWCPAHYSGPGYAWCEDPDEYNYCPSCQEHWGCGWFFLRTCNGVCAHCEQWPPTGEWFCGCGL